MRQAKGQSSMFEVLGLEDPSGRVKAAPLQTQVKHEAYRRYVPRWLDVFKNRTDDVYINDLYAGPGVYLVDGQRSPGSPVIAAQALQAVRQSAPRLQVHLRCVEPSPKLRRLLNAELDPYRADVDIAVYRGRAQDHAAAFAEESRGSPTLVLLDPNGIEVPMAMVSLFGGRKYSEVLISFDAHANRRVAGTEDTTPVTQFWGDETWEEYRRDDYTIDLTEMLEGYRQRLHDVAGFRVSTVRRLRFKHIDRAIAQGCGSTLGPKIWLQAFEAAAARFDAKLVDVAAPLNRRAMIDGALVKLRSFEGRANVTWGTVFQAVAGACDREEDLTQAFLQLKELGLVDWPGRLGRYERPAPKFTFALRSPLPAGTERSERCADQRPLPLGRSAGSGSGYSSHVRPSSRRPPAFGVRPPHCLKKKAVSASPPSPSARAPSASSIGRWPGPDSPPTISQSIPTRLKETSGPRSGSAEMKRTAAGVARKSSARPTQRLFSIEVPSHTFGSGSSAQLDARAIEPRAHQLGTLREDLIRVACRTLHHVEDLVDVFGGHERVPQVAHAVDEDATRLPPRERDVESLGMQDDVLLSVRRASTGVRTGRSGATGARRSSGRNPG